MVRDGVRKREDVVERRVWGWARWARWSRLDRLDMGRGEPLLQRQQDALGDEIMSLHTRNDLDGRVTYKSNDSSGAKENDRLRDWRDIALSVLARA